MKNYIDVIGIDVTKLIEPRAPDIYGKQDKRVPVFRKFNLLIYVRIIQLLKV